MTLARKTGEVKYVAAGPMVYPAGEYDPAVTYTRTALSVPMVLCDTLYYVLNKKGSFKGINPKTDYATNKAKATWIMMDQMKYAFIEMLMANFAKLASAVFHGNYMFSQQGTNAAGAATNDYRRFGTDAFTPNLMLNFLTGRMDANLCFLKASLYTPFRLLLPNANDVVYADFSTGFNLDIGRLVSYPTVDSILYLPKAPSYSGAVCYLYNSCTAYTRSGVPCLIKIDNNGQFLNLYNSTGSANANAIRIPARKMLRLRAVESRDMNGNIGAVYWYIENPEDCEAVSYAPNL